MEVGNENIKKGRDGIRKQVESLIQRNVESSLNSALNLPAHRIMDIFNVGKEILSIGQHCKLFSKALSLSGVRGQGYDRAASMPGRHNGLQTKVLAEVLRQSTSIAWDTN
ncbi:hypothetical protein LOD99_8515 [Oopsacas minuta]|uniref:Uncharacterized protein n=1 Tax=Oopsacas minuta TaxID=111878 RepID=A0AAV7JGA6_9METZ|nr:hypothetical protein LOD99_8515 [Oopsacas minuta]